jgi:hypothetical protein
MKLRKAVSSEFRGLSYPPGTEVTLVEPVDDARSVWLVEVRVPDGSLVGGASYDTVEVKLVDLVAEVSTASLEAEADSAELDPDEDVAAATRATTKDVELPKGAKEWPRTPIDAHPQP